MRPDGFIERYHEIDMGRQTNVHERAGQHMGFTDVIGLYRMLEQTFSTYQSTHLTRFRGMTRGVIFPFAWKLEKGDRVWNQTAQELYTVQDVAKLHDEHGDPGGEFPDVTMWLNQSYNGRFYDKLSSGWVGYAAILVNDDGEEVRPLKTDLLLFPTSRLMKFVRHARRADDDRYIVDPEEDQKFDELVENGMPAITFFKRREEPASMTGGWFSGNKILKPREITIESADLGNKRIIKWQPSELILRFELWAETAYDIDKLEIYFRRFVEKMTPILRKNGVQEVAWWQDTTDERLTTKGSSAVGVEYAFRVAALEAELDAVRRDVDIDGPYTVTKFGDEGSSPLGQPKPVTIQVDED